MTPVGKVFLVIFILIVLGVGGYFAWKYLIKKKGCKSDQDCGGENQGLCVNGKCVCKKGWTGSDCSQATQRYSCDGTTCLPCKDPTAKGCIYADPNCGFQCSPLPSPKWRCSGSHCIQCDPGQGASDGCIYPDYHCGQTCVPSYKCDGSSCVSCPAGSDGCNHFKGCNGACGVPPTSLHQCQGTTCVKCSSANDPGCRFKDSSCGPGCQPHYMCAGGSCSPCDPAVTSGCTFTDSNCNHSCSSPPPPPTYKCVGTTCTPCDPSSPDPSCTHTHANCLGACQPSPPTTGHKCSGTACVTCDPSDGDCIYTGQGCGGACNPTPAAAKIVLNSPPSSSSSGTQHSWPSSSGWPVQSYLPQDQSSSLSDPITYNPAMVTTTATEGGVLVENNWANPQATGVRTFRNFVGTDSSSQMALTFLEGTKGSCWSAFNSIVQSSPFKDSILVPPEPGVAPALPSTALASDGTLTTDQVFGGAPSTGADACFSSQFAPLSNLKSPWPSSGPNQWPSGYSEGGDGIDFDASKGLKGEFGGMSGGPGTKGWSPNLGQGKVQVFTNDGKTLSNVWLGKDPSDGSDALVLDYWATKKNGVWTLPIAGGLISSKKFASGRYEIVAKVDDQPGLIWAIWTFRAQWKASPFLKGCTELGSSTDCTVCSSCGGDAQWCANKTNKVCKDAGVDCSKSDRVKWDPSRSQDPLFLTSDACEGASLLGGMPSAQYPNHEIDIEIPSNAGVVIDPTTKRGQNQTKEGGWTSNTMNMNAYRWTNSGGSGSYENLFAVRGQLSDGTSKPSDDEKFIGDGKYHSYAFEWHTGGPDTKPIVSFYFDGDYVGSTDAFVPNLASRLWVGQWVHAPNAHGESPWAGPLDTDKLEAILAANAPGTVSKDGTHVLYARTYIKGIKISPYHEPNDRSFDGAMDQPNQNAAYSKFPSCCRLATEPFTASSLSKTITPNPTYGQCVPYGYKQSPTTNPRSLGTCDDGSAPASQTFIPFYSSTDPKDLGLMGMIPDLR